MISIEAKYHLQCLRTFYNRDRSNISTDDTTGTSRTANTAFAELISYIQSLLDEDSVTPVFQLSELKRLYLNRIQELQDDVPALSLHSTRFKNKILSYFPQLQANNEGRDVFLVCSKSVGSCLKLASQTQQDNQIILSKAASIVRKDILSTKCSPFSGTFTEKCQENSVPNSLITLVSMILYGANITDEANYLSQAGLSLSQLLVYNCVQRQRSVSMVSETRHSEERETPLPLFLGAVVHSKMRSKELVDLLFRLGLSVSYGCVLGLSADLGNSAINHFDSIGAVCPHTFNTGVFTTSAVDNIDHDPSSTMAQSSFHGTGISLFQHPGVQNAGTKQICPPFNRSGKKIGCLPDKYAVVPAVHITNKNPPIPKIPGIVQSQGILTKESLKEEHNWCKHVHEALQEPQNEQTHVSWAAYHSQRVQPSQELIPLSASALLPLFQEESESTAMIKHAMDVVSTAVAVLSPGQTPVIACDQPLYKIAKEIQWAWPETHGESSYVIMLGGLHIKMTLLKALGEILNGSGWTSAISQAGIATAGTADSFLKVSHVKKTCGAHQVTACALYSLQQQAYHEYKQTINESNVMSYEDWAASKESPQFNFWQLVLQVELRVLIWDHAIHAGDFHLYIDSLTELQWLFHALNHHHYARAVAIHLRDMVTLADRHPEIYSEFCKGNFTVNKKAVHVSCFRYLISYIIFFFLKI